MFLVEWGKKSTSWIKGKAFHVFTLISALTHHHGLHAHYISPAEHLYMNLFSIADSCQKIFSTTLKNLSKYKSLNLFKRFTFPHGSNQFLIYVTVSTGLIFAANQSNDANVSVCRSGLERFSYYIFMNRRSIILSCSIFPSGFSVSWASFLPLDWQLFISEY